MRDAEGWDSDDQDTRGFSVSSKGVTGLRGTRWDGTDVL